jgi:hypothetical protein
MTITIDTRKIATTISNKILRVAEQLEGISESLYVYGNPDYSPWWNNLE